MTQDHPTGATLHLGGDAWAMPSLETLLVPIDTLLLYPGKEAPVYPQPSPKMATCVSGQHAPALT